MWAVWIGLLVLGFVVGVMVGVVSEWDRHKYRRKIAKGAFFFLTFPKKRLTIQ